MLWWQNWLNRIIIGGLFLIPLVPLYVNNSLFFPFISSKTFLFRLIVELVLAAWCLLALIDPRVRPKRSALNITMAIFLLVLVLATIFGVDSYRSFWSNYERMEGLINFLHLGAYFLVLTGMLRTKKLWERYWQTTIGVSVIVFIMGVAEYLRFAGTGDSFARLSTSFGNPIYLAVYVLLHLFIAALLWLNAQSRGARWLYGVIIALELWTLYGSVTRSAQLGLVVGLLVGTSIFALFGREYPRGRRWAIGFLILIVLGAVSLFGFRQTDFVKGNPVLLRLTHISMTDATVRHRLLNWQTGLAGFKERPILGWGPENYLTVFSKHFDPGLYDAEPWFDRTHNIFVDWLVSAGLLGLLSYLSLYVVSLYYLWRRGSSFSLPERALFSGLFAAYLFHNIFVFDNLTSYLLFLMILGYIQFRSTGETISASAEIKGGRITGVYFVAAGALAIVLGLSLYWVNYQPIKANQDLLMALAVPDPRQKMELFKAVARRNTFGTTEAREHLLQQFNSVLANPEVELSVRNQLFNELRTELADQLKRTPDNPRIISFYGSFLRGAGQLAEAKLLMEKAYQLSPRKQSILFELFYIESNLKNFNQALAYAKEAYELEPSFVAAQEVYAVALAQAGKRSEAEALFHNNEDADESRPITDQEINLYVALGDYARVAELWEKRAKQNPTQVQFLFNLAAARFMSGNKTGAIEALGQAAKLDPQLKAQTDFLIAEIRAGRNPVAN